MRECHHEPLVWQGVLLANVDHKFNIHEKSHHSAVPFSPSPTTDYRQKLVHNTEEDPSDFNT